MQDSGFAELLYDFDWYNLPIKYQKDIRFLISRKQHGNKITVGPFGNINRELFKDVMFVNSFMRRICTTFCIISDFAEDLFFCNVSP